MIYFLQSIDGGPIKIGQSGDVAARVRQLELTYGQPLAILATMDGGRDEEQAIHGQFAHLRIGRTEQFRPASDLLAFIGRPLLVSPDPDAVEVMLQRYGMSVRLTDEAIKWARIASGYTGESVAEYVSRTVAEQGKRDADRLHAEVAGKKGGKEGRG